MPVGITAAGAAFSSLPVFLSVTVAAPITDAPTVV